MLFSYYSLFLYFSVIYSECAILRQKCDTLKKTGKKSKVAGAFKAFFEISLLKCGSSLFPTFRDTVVYFDNYLRGLSSFVKKISCRGFVTSIPNKWKCNSLLTHLLCYTLVRILIEYGFVKVLF